MKYLIYILYIVLLNAVLFAQAPDTLWTKTFGGNSQDRGYSVQQTTDGGYIIIGTTESLGAGQSDVWLIKTDANGDTLWTKTFGGSDDDYGNSVQQTTDGGYIIAGTGLIKTDANGVALWTKTFNGTGNSVQQTTDGGYIITGGSTGPIGRDVWLLKTDANGDTIWTKTFGHSDIQLLDWGNSVQQTTDGGYIITGATGFLRLGPVFPNLWLLKTDASGDTLWTKTFGSPVFYYDSGNSVEQTTDGGYIIIGTTSSFGAGHRDVWLLKTDINGDTLWTKTFGGSDYEYGNSLQQTTDGGYIITGTTGFLAGQSDVWLIKTDTNGETLWTKTLGGSDDDWGEFVQKTTDGGYIVVGYTKSFGAGGRDIWLIKLDTDPTIPVELTSFTASTSEGKVYLNWTTATETNNSGFEIERKIINVSDGEWITIGFKEGHGTTTEIQKYQFIDDVSEIQATSLSYRLKQIDYDGSYEYSDEVMVNNPAPLYYALHQNYPNPFNPVTIINYSLPLKSQVELIVYNTLGEEVIQLVNGEKEAGSYSVKLDATGLSSGVYLYRLSSKGFVQTRKMLLVK